MSAIKTRKLFAQDKLRIHERKVDRIFELEKREDYVWLQTEAIDYPEKQKL